MVKISAVIPVRNRENTISICLDSILRQTYKVDEIVICDDASTDDTISAIEAYMNKEHSTPIHLVKHTTPRGAQAARNSAIKAASGEIIVFNDSDDQWVEQKTEAQLKLMLEKHAGVVHCGALRFNENINAYSLFGHELYTLSGHCYRQILERGGVMFSGLMTIKSLLEKIGYLDEKVPAFQEWDTGIRLAKVCDFAYTPLPLFIYHVGAPNTISASKKNAAVGYEMIVNKYKKEILRYCPSCMMQHYAAMLNRFSEANISEKVQYYSKMLKICKKTFRINADH